MNSKSMFAVSAAAAAFGVGLRVFVQLEQPGRSVLGVRQRAGRLRARLPSQVLLRMLHSLNQLISSHLIYTHLDRVRSAVRFRWDRI